MHFKFTSDYGLQTFAKKSANLQLTLAENHMTEKHKLEPAINEKLITGQRKTRDLDLSPRYGRVSLVSGYPVLTAVG